jgi:TrmH family RNA methyltransferase
MITSLHNPRVQEAVRLREARYRRKVGRILIDGDSELRRAISAKVAIEVLFYCPELCPQDSLSYFSRSLAREDNGKRQTELLEVTEAVFAKLAFGHRTEGVVAVASEPRLKLDDLPLKTPPLVAVLEAAEKPGNIGAVLRSADGAGLDAVIMADAHTDLYNPNAIRASLGTIFTIPAAQTTSADALAWLKAKGLRVVAARVDGSVAYTSIDFRLPTAIVLGSEADGLSDQWNGDMVTNISLPMFGSADSLNVSAAAAVLFYEARRQRT